MYISRLTSYAPTRTSQSLITAHRANLMNSSSDNPKTLVNSRKRSQTLVHHIDEKSASVGIAAKRKRAGWIQEHPHKVLQNQDAIALLQQKFVPRGRLLCAIIVTAFSRNGPGPGKSSLLPEENPTTKEGYCIEFGQGLASLPESCRRPWWASNKGRNSVQILMKRSRNCFLRQPTPRSV